MAKGSDSYWYVLNVMLQNRQLLFILFDVDPRSKVGLRRFNFLSSVALRRFEYTSNLFKA